MNPRVQRSLWGLGKENHMLRELAMAKDSPIRTRMELHISVGSDHAKAAIACWDANMAYPARLHLAAAHRHMGVAHYLIGIASKTLTPREIKDGEKFVEDAVNAGLLAVDKSKEIRRGDPS